MANPKVRLDALSGGPERRETGVILRRVANVMAYEGPQGVIEKDRAGEFDHARITFAQYLQMAKLGSGGMSPDLLDLMTKELMELSSS